MDGLSVAAPVIGIISFGIQVTKSLIDYYSAYKSRESEIARIVKKLSDLLGLLEILQNDCQPPRFKAEDKGVLDNIEGAILDCEELIGELRQEMAKLKDLAAPSDIWTNTRAVGRRLAYPFRQGTLQKLNGNIDEVCSCLSFALQILHQKDIGHIQDNIGEDKALLDLVRASQISSTLREWLKSPEVTEDYNGACNKKHHGTGLWFVNSRIFTNWLTKPRSFLWIDGIAGCGKSVLCSTAIQWCFRHRRYNSTVGIAFFFFKFSDGSKQTRSSMLRALVLQLSGQLKDNLILSELHNNHLSGVPSDPILLSSLHNMIHAFSEVYIVLDALDESPISDSRRDVLQFLVDVRSWQEPGLHLLVTSRDAPDIRECLNPQDHEVVSMKNTSVDNDISAFVTSQLRDNPQFEKWKEYHADIEKAFTKRAKGMFRWVECQFIALESCPRSKRRLDKMLASLPQSLNETYQRMLSNIDTLSTEDAQRILRFLCCAKRELTVPELIEVIAIELGDNPTLNIDGRYSGADDIRKVCPGLIEVDVHQEGELDTVRLSHYSVREYLESEQIRQHEVAKFGVDISESHTEAANICLTYLLEPGLSERMIWVIEYPLASYAAELWFMHFRDVKTWTPELKRLTMRLFRDPRAFQSWIKIWDSDWEGEHVKSSDRSPVYYASLLGLDSVISEILGPESPNDLLENPLIKDTSQLVNIRSGRHGTPLQAASFGGHEKAVKVLLNYRADVSTGGGKYGSALQAGAYKGHDRVVQMLLNNKANIKSQARFVESALQGAALNGHVEVIKALLACDGEISFQIGCFTNSLQAASYKGYYGVAQLLLNNIGIFKAHNGFYGNSLQTAALKGYTDIVQLLLNRNADVNAKAGQYGTALQAASFGGHEDIMTLLLKSDAEVNALGGQYGTALQAASFKGYKNAVQILFDNKAGVGVLGGEFGSALQAAEVGKHTEIAQLLRSSLSTTDDSGVEQVPSQSVITDLGPLSIIQIPGGKQEPVVAAYRRGSASIAQASNFDTVLLIDDTGSMQLAYESDPYWMIGKSRWMLLIDSLTHLVDILLHHGTDSMAVHFINSPEKNVEDIQSGQQIINLLSNEIELERSAGGTFLTRSLERILSPYLNRLSHINKNAKKAENEGNPPLMFPKRLNIVVVSDGNADDSSDTEEYIVDVAKELDRLDAPPNQVRIHVLQIGEDEEASKWLKMFDARLHAAYPMRDISDARPFDSPDAIGRSFQDRLEQILLEETLWDTHNEGLEL